MPTPPPSHTERPHRLTRSCHAPVARLGIPHGREDHGSVHPDSTRMKSLKVNRPSCARGWFRVMDS